MSPVAKHSFAQQCLDLLKREDIRSEFKLLLTPILDFIWYEMNPYIYVIVTLVFLIFVMLLAVLILLVLHILGTSPTSDLLPSSVTTLLPSSAL